ncbi:TonB-dependent receptor [Seleniivibrio woodruffii]|uniref:TonB-dependent receptor n=1 Tax=Seleniivibrio woodruffii TaxID=1078050 RepID=UPI0026EC97F2|nr:TonB-dependent receptor [Seleniivibrio woodruffii]
MSRLLLAALLLFAVSAAAEEVVLNPIEVTANKMSQDVQSVPAGITVFTDQDTADKGISQTKDIFERTPNMYLTKMGPLGYENMASVRGITSFMTGSPVLSFYVDDVYYPGFDINLLDVERIEVLRGPQGTIYGRNSEAGVINIITKQPENEWSGTFGASYGSYDTYDANFSGNGALIKDRLYVRTALKYTSTDGYFENVADGSDDVDKATAFDGKLAFTLVPNSSWNISLKADGQKYDSNYAEFSTFDKVKDGDFEVDVNQPGSVERDAYGLSLKADYEKGGGKFTSITNFRNEEYDSLNDLDFTSYDMMELSTYKKTDSFSQEFRYVSGGTASPIRFTSGLYFYKEKEEQKVGFDMIAYSVLSMRYGDTDTTGAAVYGQADYTVGKLVLTAGLRYENTQKDFDYRWAGGNMIGYTDTDGSTDRSFDAVLPKASVTYNFTDNFRAFVSASRGFRSGGFNLNSDVGRAYDSEFTWNYEAGVKAELLNRKMMLSASVFRIDWTDMQVEIPSYPDFVIENAAEARSKGFEAEVRYLPVGWAEIYAGAGFVNAEFEDYETSAADYSGNKVPNVPENTYNVGTTLRFLNNWFVNAEMTAAGKIEYDAENSMHQNSYQVANARIGYETEKFDVYLWAKNIFDEAYATRAFEMSGEWYARAGDPRTIGVNMNYRF